MLVLIMSEFFSNIVSNYEKKRNVKMVKIVVVTANTARVHRFGLRGRSKLQPLVKKGRRQCV